MEFSDDLLPSMKCLPLGCRLEFSDDLLPSMKCLPTGCRLEFPEDSLSSKKRLLSGLVLDGCLSGLSRDAPLCEVPGNKVVLVLT